MQSDDSMCLIFLEQPVMMGNLQVGQLGTLKLTYEKHHKKEIDI